MAKATATAPRAVATMAAMALFGFTAVVAPDPMLHVAMVILVMALSPVYSVLIWFGVDSLVVALASRVRGRGQAEHEQL